MVTCLILASYSLSISGKPWCVEDKECGTVRTVRANAPSTAGHTLLIEWCGADGRQALQVVQGDREPRMGQAWTFAIRGLEYLNNLVLRWRNSEFGAFCAEWIVRRIPECIFW